MLTVKSDGYWLHAILPNGAMSPVSYTTSMRGPLVAQWDMTLPVGFTHPALRQGALVQVFAGPLCVWSGTMADPDRNAWHFVADGLHRRGERFDAAFTDASKTLDDAIDAAIGRDLPWTRPESISTTFTVTDGSVSDALDAYCAAAGKQWRVDPYGQVRVYDLPTEVDWALTPDVPAMPTADDDYASTLVITYSSGRTAVSDDAAAERWGVREETIDLSSLGLSASEAVSEALLANRKARPAFTDGVEVTRMRLTTPGGTPPEFWQVAAGIQRVKQHGTLTSDGAANLGPLEWVIGATSYTDGSGTIALTPMGRLARAQAEVVAQQTARLNRLELKTA
ncbi:hypothetical protein [Nocardioides aquiterrae]|uniref:Uncharacterized protein n=1 Tax=Nocardioides aquiterrae TaxID=203799 RepID=A0ABN1UCM5_9ACTN